MNTIYSWINNLKRGTEVHMVGPLIGIVGRALAGSSTGIDLARTAVGVAGAVGVAIATARAINRKRPFVENIAAGTLLYFPHDLEQYAISMAFDFSSYQRRSIFEQPYLKPKGTIRLPISRNIVDSYKMDWDTKAATSATLGASMEAALEAYQKRGDMSGMQALLNSSGEILVSGAQGAAFDASKFLVSGDTLGQLLQPFGLAQNPFLTVLFKQPTFKEFKFSWKLIPRNPEEANTIQGIINTFKYHMLPDIAAGTAGTLLNYPSIVNIGFKTNDEYLFRFKPCVITNMQVNYSPAATPAFFKGSENVPSEIDLSLSVYEIEYWTKSDFIDSVNGQNRGYIPGVF